MCSSTHDVRGHKGVLGAPWLITPSAFLEAHSRLPTHVLAITTAHLASMSHMDLVVTTPPNHFFFVPTSLNPLATPGALPFRASSENISILTQRQGPMNYIMAFVPRAVRCSAPGSCIGDPLLARAHELGSSARRNTLMWSKFSSLDDR
jgi:hypothetical protein